MVSKNYLITNYREATMKLTYRGINYRITPQEVEPEQPQDAIALDKQLESDKTNTQSRNSSPKIQDSCNNRQLILIRPIHYYTYRGVSYTKNLTFDNRSKNLLDIDRN